LREALPLEDRTTSRQSLWAVFGQICAHGSNLLNKGLDAFYKLLKTFNRHKTNKHYMYNCKKLSLR